MTQPISLKTTFWNRLEDEEFFHFCQQNSEWVIERDHEGTIYLMSPVGFESGNREATLISELYAWNKKHQAGGVFSSSSGFTFADSSVFSPDAAFVLKNRIDSLSADQKKKFAPIAPDFVAEIRSPSDDVALLHAKMERYIINGVRLAWLIDPMEEKAWVYAPDQKTVAVADFAQTLGGGEVLPGFEFPLALLK
jgi:Uma2 family endonuclease